MVAALFSSLSIWSTAKRRRHIAECLHERKKWLCCVEIPHAETICRSNYSYSKPKITANYLTKITAIVRSNHTGIPTLTTKFHMSIQQSAFSFVNFAVRTLEDCMTWYNANMFFVYSNCVFILQNSLIIQCMYNNLLGTSSQHPLENTGCLLLTYYHPHYQQTANPKKGKKNRKHVKRCS